MVGAPRKFFKSEKEFLKKFEDYIKYCEDNSKFANVAGFAVYAKMNRDTFYEYKKRYPFTGEMIDNILEDYTINSNINHLLKMFYLKAKFKYNDHDFENKAGVNRVTIVDDLPNCDDGDNDESN